MRGVNPAIETPAQVVDDCMRIPGAEIRVELLTLVSHAIAIGVLEIPDVRRGAGDDAFLIKYEAGDEFELVGKDMLFVHHAVAIGVFEPGNAVDGIAVVFFRPGAAVLPLLHIQLAAAVRILGRLADPQAALFIPVDVHDLVDERLGGDEREIELGMHFDFLRGLVRMRGTALDVAEVVAEFLRLAKFVRVFTLAGPGDAAQEQRAQRRMAEVFVIVAGDAHERTVGILFIGPHLWLDVVDADDLAALGDFLGALVRLFVACPLRFRRVGTGQDATLWKQVHVVIDLVVHGEVRHVLGDRVLLVRKVEMHRAFEPLRWPLMIPRTSNKGFKPRRISRDRSCVDRHDATAAGHEFE
ncbi:unannotated protein [freshwater metagenome]|uniref:Unannotated protein n=1 Tax=freshwater metagenome TaxID=449393 RepID=A0A6J6F4X7_9ZZZZ